MTTKSILFILLTATAAFILPSCTKDVEVIVDSSLPQGAFSSSKTGSIVSQNDTNSKGAVNVGTDSKGTNFVKLGSDFSTVLATGTVTVYLSTSMVFVADPGNGNPNLKLIGTVAKNGEQYLKLASAPDAKFTHLILWCGSANVPFGYASLK